MEISIGTGKRKLSDLSTDELTAIRALNQQLTDTEYWIHQRAQQCLSAYYAAGGVRRHRFDNELQEDVEVEAKVTCVLRTDHPDFKADNDNIVTELDASILLIEECANDLRLTNWDELHAGAEHPLTDVHFCYLFHDLFDHKNRGDWDRTLMVGGLWIDVTLIQQRLVSWS
ncbi:hypothetical protein [Paraburkholderia sp. MM6662-R1]|uniref:hypothetical protein n=1 Tax=Paraburkholderia sp. MM6662-R1 TaxID=2991066 RepID=UPI003D1D5107